MNKNGILLTNIQRFSLHDGPGIRTAVFMKGCSIHCPWCSNPENLSSGIQRYIKDGTEGIYGFYYTCDELYDELIKDKPFYANENSQNVGNNVENIEQIPGGVTFSGGECLLQIKELIPLLERLRLEHIHIAVESCLFVPEESLILALKYIDLLYVDIKILDSRLCQKHIKGNLQQYLKNIDLLADSGKSVVFRVPVINGYTDSNENRKRVTEFIRQYAYRRNSDLLKVELIKEHNLGRGKYMALSMCNEGYKLPEYKGVDDGFMADYAKEIAIGIGNKVPIEICKL